MVTVTRFNGTKVTLNCLLIETIEQTPDTVITLTTGKKIIVIEKADDVISLIQDFLKSIGPLKAIVKNQDVEESSE